MAKNDYYTIVAKILVYLYRKYKGLTSDSEKIIPMSGDYPVEEKQLMETIGMMQEQNFIKGIIIRDWGGEIVIVDYDSLKITPQGIDYLRENSTIRKVCETLKEAAQIWSLFMWKQRLSRLRAVFS